MPRNACAIIFALSAVIAAPAAGALDPTKPTPPPIVEKGVEKIPDIIVGPEEEKRTEGPRSNGPITIGPYTQIHAVVILGWQMKQLLGGADGYETGFELMMRKPFTRKLEAAGRPTAIWTSSPENIGETIFVYLEVDLKPNSNPYRVSLIAVQGTKVWSASIDRPYYIRLNSMPGPRKDGRLFDGTPYWDPLRDTSELAEQFASSIRVAK